MKIEELADKYNTLRDEHTALEKQLTALIADNTWRCPYGAGHVVPTELESHAMANMSHHIAALKNEMTGEQIDRATNGAARELLHGRDEYDRAERWMALAERFSEQQAMSDEEGDRLLAEARALERD